MEATILVYKENPKYTGLIISGTLYRTDQTPQFFPKSMTKKWLSVIVRFYNEPFTTSLDDFKLVNVEYTIKETKEE